MFHKSYFYIGAGLELEESFNWVTIRLAKPKIELLKILSPIWKLLLVGIEDHSSNEHQVCLLLDQQTRDTLFMGFLYIETHSEIS